MFLCSYLFVLLYGSSDLNRHRQGPRANTVRNLPLGLPLFSFIPTPRLLLPSLPLCSLYLFYDPTMPEPKNNFHHRHHRRRNPHLPAPLPPSLTLFLSILPAPPNLPLPPASACLPTASPRCHTPRPLPPPDSPPRCPAIAPLIPEAVVPVLAPRKHSAVYVPRRLPVRKSLPPQYRHLLSVTASPAVHTLSYLSLLTFSFTYNVTLI